MKFHQYVFNTDDIEKIFQDEVFKDVISSPAFKRLHSINFLGAIDYLLPIGSNRTFKRHSRYHHSLAVADLALQYCELCNLRDMDRVYCVVAALLHDIGHAPLSHSLEPTFKSEFKIDHHVSGEKILKGEVAIGYKLSKILSDANINNFRVMSIIAGKDETKYNDLFSRSINVDTIEAILRSSTYLYETNFGLTAPRILDALVRRGRAEEEMLDAFWELKGKVYTQLIQAPMGIMADFICNKYMENNAADFKSSYYYGTEKELKDDHGDLFRILDELGKYKALPDNLTPNGSEIFCIKRNFNIDSSVRLTDSASISKRYIQSKSRVSFILKKPQGVGGERIDDEKYQGSFDLFK